MSELGKKLKQRLKKMQRDRTLHENVWDDNAKLFYPYRGDVTTKLAKGQQRIETVLDSTGMEAADSAANFIHGNLFGDRWANIGFRYGTEVDEQTSFAGDYAAQRTGQRVLDALDQSNFYAQAFEFIRDMMVLGTGIFRIRERPKKARFGNAGSNFGGFSFKSVFPVAGYISENEYGDVDTVFYEFEVKAYEALEEYGRLPRNVADSVEQDPDQMVKLVFCVFPILPESMPWTTEAGKGPFGGVTLFCETESDEDEVVDKTTFEINPYVVGRWMQVEGETWGRGPGHKARPDMKSLNAIERQKQIAVAMDLRPPLLAPHDGIMNVDILPGAVVSIKQSATGLSPTYLRSESKYDAAEMIVQEMRRRVKAAFLMDVIGEKDTEPRSAEESIRRDRRAFVRLAGPTNRISREFLTPLLETVIRMMLEADALPELADFMKVVEDASLEITYQSPLLVAQREGTLSPLLQSFAEDAQAFAATQDQRYLDPWDPDGLQQIKREVRGLDTRAFLSPDDVAQIRQARAEQQQAAMMMEAAQTTADVVNKVGGSNVAPE